MVPLSELDPDDEVLLDVSPVSLVPLVSSSSPVSPVPPVSPGGPVVSTPVAPRLLDELVTASDVPAASSSSRPEGSPKHPDTIRSKQRCDLTGEEELRRRQKSHAAGKKNDW